MRRRLANDPAWSGTLRETLDGDGSRSGETATTAPSCSKSRSRSSEGASSGGCPWPAPSGGRRNGREPGGGSPRRDPSDSSSLGADRPPRGLRPAWRSEGSSAAFPSAPRGTMTLLPGVSSPALRAPRPFPAGGGAAPFERPDPGGTPECPPRSPPRRRRVSATTTSTGRSCRSCRGSRSRGATSVSSATASRRIPPRSRSGSASPTPRPTRSG